LRYGAPTVAVLPSPCDSIYLAANKGLAAEIVDNNGLLITEYGTGTEVSRYSLVDRDRIQSMLSKLLVVIQAADDGGSMIAVRRSLDDGKRVFALAGNDLKLIKDYIDPSHDSDMRVFDVGHTVKQTTLF